MHLIGALAALAAFLALASCATAPQAHYWDTAKIPESVESVRLDYTDKSGARKDAGTVSRAQITELRRVVQRIRERASVRIDRIFVSDQQAANASAGYRKSGEAIMTITVEMLALLRADTDQMAALVGHETAHLAKRHGQARQAAKEDASRIGLIVGTVLEIGGAPFGRTVAGLAGDAVVAAYSRDQEREADELGVRLAHGAGYDPEGALRLFRALVGANSRKPIPFLGTHPYIEERIANVTEIVRGLKRNQDASGLAP